MLEVQSPLPMTEGEIIAFGVSTKHLIQFTYGVLFSLPISLLGALTSPFTHLSIVFFVLFSGAIGAAFAVLQFRQQWTLGEVVLLRVRYHFRPKVRLYSRTHRLQYKDSASEVIDF